MALRGVAWVIAHVVAKLAAVRGVVGIVEAVAPADPWWMETAEGFGVPVATVDGGVERSDSVLNALDYLGTVAADDDLVMVHDAVRPCVDVADIERVVATARRDPHGAILAAPVSDRRCIQLIGVRPRADTGSSSAPAAGVGAGTTRRRWRTFAARTP